MKPFVLILFAQALAAQPEAASALNQRCVDSWTRGEYSTAERLCRESIAQWEAQGAAFSAHLATTRVNLAQALAGQGRRAEARGEAQQAVAVLRVSPGPADPH